MQQSRGAGGRPQRTRTALVASELAGSLMLLVVAGLFLRSLVAAQHLDLGFSPGQVLNLTLDPHQIGMGPAARVQFHDALLQRVRRLPGVSSASLAGSAPFDGVNDGAEIRLPGQGLAPHDASASAGVNIVTPEYLPTMGIPLLRGRAFTDADAAGSARVGLINQAMASRFWPHQDAVGQFFALSDHPNAPIQVIGIAANSRTGSISDSIGPYFYLPLAQWPLDSLYADAMNPLSQEVLQVRTQGAPMALSPAVEAVIHGLAPRMPVLEVEPMAALLDSLNGLALFRLGALLAGILGALGLLLAGIGVFGVVAYAASQRTHEIGVRVALGARRSQVLALVLRQALWMLALGLALGLLLAAAASLAVNNLLIGVSGRDPVTYL
ncbi:MAG: ABC transporter permease, partial [Terriglobales bacterium]